MCANARALTRMCENAQGCVREREKETRTMAEVARENAKGCVRKRERERVGESGREESVRTRRGV